MSSRVIPCFLGAAVLTLVGLAVWLPTDFASPAQTVPESEPPTSEANRVAGECVFFVTFRPADFSGDELATAIFQDMPKSLERELHASAFGIDRVTLAVGRHGPVRIIRTKKPYDAAKLRDALSEPQYQYVDRGKDSPQPPKPAIYEKKAGGKTIYYRWTQAWCPIDKKTFMTGHVAALEAFLTTKGKPSKELADALALGTTHSLVLAVDGERLRSMRKLHAEDKIREEREWRKMQKDGSHRDRQRAPARDLDSYKDTSFYHDSPRHARDKFYLEALQMSWVRAALRAEGHGDALNLVFGSPEAGVVLMPFKPLASAKFCLLTLDLGKAYTLTTKIGFANKRDLDDGETAVKSLLYVGRQMVAVLPKHHPELMALQPLIDPLNKALEDAKIVRKDNSLEAAITLNPAVGLAKKVRERREADRKKDEEERRKQQEAGTDKD